MKAVEGYTKDDYKTECAAEGGKVFEFSSLDEAAGHLASMAGQTMEVAREGILNDTNCDWVLFADGGVLFRYYGRNYDKDHIATLKEAAK